MPLAKETDTTVIESGSHIVGRCDYIHDFGDCSARARCCGSISISQRDPS